MQLSPQKLEKDKLGIFSFGGMLKELKSLSTSH